MEHPDEAPCFAILDPLCLWPEQFALEATDFGLELGCADRVRSVAFREPVLKLTDELLLRGHHGLLLRYEQLLVAGDSQAAQPLAARLGPGRLDRGAARLSLLDLHHRFGR